MKSLRAAANELRDWLLSTAFPVWWEHGADHSSGGFHDTLTAEYTPADVGKRLRVQARQTYVYAAAGRLGWSGNWRDAVAHGITYMMAKYDRRDGFFSPTADGGQQPRFYDQAFALFALSEGVGSGHDTARLRQRAKALLSTLDRWRLDDGGFAEPADQHIRQSNPHMHLLEAALAWEALDPDGPWVALADEIVDLALRRFIDSNGGLHEFFAPHWVFSPGLDGRIVEPGHQFEWAWLLDRWSKSRGAPEARRVAEQLYRTGTSGVDKVRRVANQQMLDDASVHDPVSRLWPQTEWLKAALRFGTTEEALAAADAVSRYLDDPSPGLWRDKLMLSGEFVEEPAPASSFYHIVLAIEELVTFHA